MQVFNHRLQDGKPLNVGYYLSGNKESTKVESISKIDGLTLFEAAEKGNMAAVASFLLGGVDPNVTERDGERATALHYAARGGEQLVVRFLIDNGAFVDAAAGNGSTPLMWGANANHPDVVIGLLTSGAKPSAADDQGLTIAMHAAANPPILHILRSHGVKLDMEVSSDSKQTLLHRAANTGTQSKTAWAANLYLIETGCIEVDAQDASGRTAFHYACANNDLDGCKALMQKGASNTIKDSAGHVPSQVPTCRSGPVKKFISKFTSESSNSKQQQLAQRDFSNYAALDMKQIQHFLVAFFVPNTIVMLAAYLPTWIGVFSLFVFAGGFGAVAQFSMGRKVRSMATAGWFSGALFYGSGILFKVVFPAYNECHEPFPIAYYLWWMTTVPMFICYAMAVLKDPGVVQSTPEARAEIYDGIASAGEGEIQRMGYDLTTMVRKPLRSKHCSKTGHCVCRFDHFCVWTGNAIGGGNHRQFVLYCLFQAIAQSLVVHITTSYMFYCTPKLEIANGEEGPSGFFGYLSWMTKNSDHAMVTYFLLVYNSFVLLFVSTVLISQLWYVTRNVTSNEVWFAQRYKWMMQLGSRAYSMYDMGTWGNIKDFFFTGDLCAVEYNVPPMNEHLKKLSKRFAAQVRAQSDAASKMGGGGDEGGAHGRSHGGDDHHHGHSHSHGGGGAAGGHGGDPDADELLGGQSNFDMNAAMNALPEETQQELQDVQLILQELIQGQDPQKPGNMSGEKWDRLLGQARSMHEHYMNAMSSIPSALPGGSNGGGGGFGGSPNNSATPQPTRRKND